MGCSDTEEKVETAGYISAAELSDSEETLLMAVTGSDYFVYDINILDDTIGWVEYWIEHYQYLFRQFY
jgi:hypothetical protein